MKTYIKVIDSLNNIHTFIKEEHYYEWEVEQNILLLHIYKIQKDEDYIIASFLNPAYIGYT